MAQATDLQIVAITPEQAETFAADLVAQDPWNRLGYTDTALCRFLMGGEGRRVLGCSAQGLEQATGAPSEKASDRAAAGAPKAVIKANPMALLCIKDNWLFGPFVQLIYTAPAHRKSALGSKILEWLAHDAAAQGARHVWASVDSNNAGAARFFERHGFKPQGQLPDLVTDGATEILVGRRLTGTA